MMKKIVLGLIFLFLAVSYVSAFEVPSEFDVEYSLDYNGWIYINNDDDYSGQAIKVLTEEEYEDNYMNDFENYSYYSNDDGTFDFFYFGEQHHCGIGKEYGNEVVLFWNKDPNLSDGDLKDLILECDSLN